MSPPSVFITVQVLNHPHVAVFQSTVEQLVKDKMPKKSGRWWFSWRRRDMSRSEVRPKTFYSKSGCPNVPDDAFLLFFSKGNQRRRQRNRCQQILLQSSNFCCSSRSDFNTFAFQFFSYFMFIFMPAACTWVCLLSSRATPSDMGLEKAAELDSEAPDQSAESLSTTQRINQIYRKSLRLTSEQIVRVLQKD